MSDETFLQRWSRLKAEKRREETAPAPEPAAPAEAAAPPAPVEVTQAAPEEKEPPELPPVETLTAESDYSLFMRAEVPEETRLAALRKLWTSDPVLAAQDPLDFQNLDFTFPTVPDVVKTAYVVGKGFLDAAEKLAPAEEGKAEKEESAEKPAGEAAAEPAETPDRSERG
jgi:hypothetical protein